MRALREVSKKGLLPLIKERNNLMIVESQYTAYEVIMPQ